MRNAKEKVRAINEVENKEVKSSQKCLVDKVAKTEKRKLLKILYYIYIY